MTSDPAYSESEALIGAFILFLGIGLIFYLIPTIIIYWKLFVKAGQAGWKAIIPPYLLYMWGVIGKRPTVGIVAAVTYLVYFPLTLLEKTPATTASLGISGLVYIIFGLAALSLFIRQYDAGIGKWFLFLFLPLIGVFFVDKVNYKGGETPATPATPVAPTNTTTTPSQTPSQTPPQPPTNQPLV